MLISMNEHRIDTPHKNFLSFSFIFSGNLEQREFPEIARGKVTLINAFRIIERSCIHILKIKIKVFGSV